LCELAAAQRRQQGSARVDVSHESALAASRGSLAGAT